MPLRGRQDDDGDDDVKDSSLSPSSKKVFWVPCLVVCFKKMITWRAYTAQLVLFLLWE